MRWASAAAFAPLQWSPVLETGNTSTAMSRAVRILGAAMEPGLRDREYRPASA